MEHSGTCSKEYDEFMKNLYLNIYEIVKIFYA